MAEKHPSLQHNVFENWDRRQLEGFGYYGIPAMQATSTVGDQFIRFMDWKTCENPADHIAHFFYDDYKFIQAWRNPGRYLKQLRQFKAVITPDFSLYTDFPRALQILACYRRMWLGAFWQDWGIDVIPNAVWGDRESWDYCFEGLPKNSTIALSTVGIKRDAEWNGKKGTLFLDGYKEMLDRVSPTAILLYGSEIDGLEGNIIRIPAFYEERRKKIGKRGKM